MSNMKKSQKTSYWTRDHYRVICNDIGLAVPRRLTLKKQRFVSGVAWALSLWHNEDRWNGPLSRINKRGTFELSSHEAVPLDKVQETIQADIAWHEGSK